MISTAALARTVAIVATAAVALACGASAQTGAAMPSASSSVGGLAASRSAAIEVKGFAFSPQRLEVSKGTTVTWTNGDNILHTATSGTSVKADDLGHYTVTPDGKFNGTMDDQGKSFSFTFDTAGEFAYYCARHNNMMGIVVVK
ncbi:MAG: plastocyanin/azurin family copper-binding protein [Candidatus Limnocylindria bacterium]